MGEDIPMYRRKANPLVCFMCGKDIELVCEDDKDQEICGAFKDASCDSFASGYGSKHDTDVFSILICDDCMDIALNKGRTSKIGNYMSDSYDRKYREGT